MNILIFGSGTKLGHDMHTYAAQLGHNVHGVSGKLSDDSNILTVDWNTCDISSFEKYLRQLPKIDIVIFNQNAPAFSENYKQLGQQNILQVWKETKQWQQSFYVNCILPMHVLHTLAETKRIESDSRIVWLLSKVILSDLPSPMYYSGQKYQNYVIMKTLAECNPYTFIGICPGKVTTETQSQKAQQIIDFLIGSNKDCNGNFYSLNNIFTKLNLNISQ